ncbi:MAG: TlpA family protein disulfide reductase [Bacteroidetes bacterium]|nr:TlpA family protein disulfide reductase [Bacteroidota bacterium]
MQNRFLLWIPFLLLPFSANSQSIGSYRIDLENGKSVRISDLTANGPLIITFWALWCKPCLAEMKTFPSLLEKFRESGLTILAVNQDSPKSTAKIKSFLKTNGLDVVLALDSESEVLSRFNGEAIPLTLLVDQTGTVVYRQTGYFPGDEAKLETAIQLLLAGKGQ